LAQDDYYYEIQLTNKQLVFYFMAGATGLILSFLAGVMVGRGVDAGDVQAARPAPEERVVSEEPLARPTAPPSAGDLTYAQRLEGEKTDDSLERPKGGAAGSSPAKAPIGESPVAAKARPAETGPAKVAEAKGPETKPAEAKTVPPAKAAESKPPQPKGGESKPAETKPAEAGTAASKAAEGKTAESKSTRARPSEAPAPSRPAAKPALEGTLIKLAPGTFSIQVGAFKDKASAESVVSRLKGKGFAAFVISPEGGDGGFFLVRVGSYVARADAERAETKLRDQEKFKPYIVKN
jgi:cell division protein FtsN